MLRLRRVLTKRIAQRILKCFYSAEGRVLTSNLPDIEIPNRLLPDLVLDRFGLWEENRIALECAITGRNYTFRQTKDFSVRLNKSLRKKLKLQRQDVVAVLLPNVPEFPIVAIGILKAGLVITPINPVYTAGEINKQLNDSSAKAIVTMVDLYNLARSSLAEINIPVITIKSMPDQATPQGAIDFMELINENVDIPEVRDVSPSDLATLPYSSGTTGLPKGVRLLHSNIVANICQLAHPDINMTPFATADFQAVIPAVLPMFHIYGFTVLCMVQLFCGAKTVTLPKFTPELYVSTLMKHKPHVLYLVPPIAIFLGAHPGLDKQLFERLESVVCGAAPLGGLDEAKLIKKSQKNIIITQGYGLTETSPCVLCTGRAIKRSIDCPGSIGMPVPNTQVKIIDIDDKDGKPLGPNQKGELLVKGPQVMPGYHNRPKETEDAFLDGWLRTGDIMYYDDRGLFYITDRLKELIKVKGFQVAPAELEEIIRDHPDVADAAVIGVPHQKDGEAPKAVVVLKSGANVDVNKIKDFVNDKVTGYKQLRGGVVVVDSIPKNASGKILRRVLKLKYG